MSYFSKSLYVLVGLVIAGTVVAWGAQPQSGVHAPPGCNPYSGSPNSVTLFKDNSFGGQSWTITNVTGHPGGVWHKIPAGLHDEVTSLRWNLPHGVIVLMSNHDNGTGRLFPVWGNWANANISGWEVNDLLSAWAWYRM